MLTGIGLRKKENSIIMDSTGSNMPQLSNEMQLSIMNKVKSGELTIEDALNEARRDRKPLLQQPNQSIQDQEVSQHNFSVHKHNRYRWQKRVLQIDFNTKMVCSIEKGIIKRQLHFESVKSCEDGAGARFSISFRGRHDYELEATSLDDKHKIMQLVNTIIYQNIYSPPAEGSAETHGQTLAPKSIREGQLMLHRGGLASFKWRKFEAQLRPGQLTLVPFSKRGVSDDRDMTSTAPLSVVIHLSDGDVSIERPGGCDSFTLLTHKNEYQFRIPVTDGVKSSEAVQMERDAWVLAIDKLCLEWKRKSQSEPIYEDPKAVQGYNRSRDTEEKPTGKEPVEDLTSTSPDPDPVCTPTVFLHPSAFPTSPDPDMASPVGLPPAKIPVPSAKIPVPPAKIPVPPAKIPVPPAKIPFPPAKIPVPPAKIPIPPANIPVSPANIPLPSAKIPLPPPLPPLQLKCKPPSERTKAFHWDLVSSDKIGKSFWMLGSTRKIEIQMSRLYEQFAVQDLGTFDVTESNNNNIHIMLNQKIAHNFNIFLKSFPVQPGELKDKLFILNEDDGGLSDEHITSLRRYVPTSDDVEMYQSHKGPASELHIVDQYMMEMCNIPYLGTRLDLLLTLRELPTSMDDLQPLINQKIRMCMQLLGSRSFVCVLECLLAIGNYLNQNAGKRKARGFRLSSLTKLSQLRGRDRKFTLLHALVEQVMFHEPSSVTFFQELAEFETVPGASIKGLTAEVDVVKNELQKVIQYRNMYKKGNTGDQHTKFSKDLKMAIEKYKTDLSLLTKGCEEMKRCYADILVRFGEPLDKDSHELFGGVSQFVNDFKRIHAQII